MRSHCLAISRASRSAECRLARALLQSRAGAQVGPLEPEPCRGGLRPSLPWLFRKTCFGDGARYVIVVIQCARSKQKNAGHLKTNDGRPVSFVAHPEFAPPAVSCVYARPDDASDAGGTWRDRLPAYNASPTNNPLGLLPAFELYENDIYR